jgi:alpha-L-arabinofuranosidase
MRSNHITVGPIGSELAPDGQVFELYSAHQGNRLIKLSGDTDESIDACALIAPDGKAVFVTLVNEDASSAREVELSLANFKDLHTASAELLVSQTLEVGGDFSRHQQALTIQDGNKVRLKIPRFSVAGVLLTSR